MKFFDFFKTSSSPKSKDEMKIVESSDDSIKAPSLWNLLKLLKPLKPTWKKSKKKFPRSYRVRKR